MQDSLSSQAEAVSHPDRVNSCPASAPAEARLSWSVPPPPPASAGAWDVGSQPPRPRRPPGASLPHGLRDSEVRGGEPLLQGACEPGTAQGVLGAPKREMAVSRLCAEPLQSCLTLCDPRDCSPPDSSVQGILQARILEWVAMPSSRGSSESRD